MDSYRPSRTYGLARVLCGRAHPNRRGGDTGETAWERTRSYGLRVRL
jgi:hypothetical protein